MKKEYYSPEMKMQDIAYEGVLCSSEEDSTEGLGENIGSWG